MTTLEKSVRFASENDASLVLRSPEELARAMESAKGLGLDLTAQTLDSVAGTLQHCSPSPESPCHVFRFVFHNDE